MSSLLPRRERTWVWLTLLAPLLVPLCLVGCDAQPPAAAPEVAAPAPSAPVEVTPVVSSELPRYLPPVTGNGKKPKPRPAEVFEEAREDTVLLQFTASWCPPCQVMRPIVDDLIAKGYPIRRYDFDARRKFAHAQDVHSVPTFILFVKGEEVHRFSGSTSQESLVSLFKKHKIRPVP